MANTTEEQRKISEASLANLKPFQPGQSGNPGGRPKGRSLTALLRDRLDEVDEATGKTIAQLVVEGWLNAARDGNVPAIKEALDRTEGKVPDKVQVDDMRKAYVTESPETLWPSDENNDPTNPMALPEPSGEM
jgi:hypothetical protein